MRCCLALMLVLLSGMEDRESLRFTYSREQGYDDSCGFQALACFLGLYWRIPVDEEELFSAFLLAERPGADPPEAGEARTVSLEDLRIILCDRGFLAEAWEMCYEGLVKACASYAPLLVHYDKPRGHFVVLLGADAGGVIVADPAEGLVFLSSADFGLRWSGNTLLARLPGASPDEGLLAAARAAAAGPMALLRASAMLARRLGP